MHILDLPSELLNKILVQAVLARWKFEETYGEQLGRWDFARGIARGLRLKLVCSRSISFPMKPTLFLQIIVRTVPRVHTSCNL
jgi:hypothetical protein